MGIVVGIFGLQARSRRLKLEKTTVARTQESTPAPVAAPSTQNNQATGAPVREPGTAELANAAPPAAAAIEGATEAPVPQGPARGALPSSALALGEPTSVPAAASGASAADCEATLKASHWHQASEACAVAFAAQPTNAGLALKMAQAEHARAHYAVAGDWAKRALALDNTLPEAFVIVAHAEASAGHPEAATRAFRQYLVLAPRGWHASEARAALRGGHPREHARARAHNTPANAAPEEAVPPLAAAVGND